MLRVYTGKTFGANSFKIVFDALISAKVKFMDAPPSYNDFVHNFRCSYIVCGKDVFYFDTFKESIVKLKSENTEGYINKIIASLKKDDGLEISNESIYLMKNCFNHEHTFYDPEKTYCLTLDNEKVYSPFMGAMLDKNQVIELRDYLNAILDKQ